MAYQIIVLNFSGKSIHHEGSNCGKRCLKVITHATAVKKCDRASSFVRDPRLTAIGKAYITLDNGSTCPFDFFQVTQPPFRTRTRWKPDSNNIWAARMLASSFGQAQ